LAGTPDAILIVCGGMLQVPAVPIAHGLGLKVVMTDANPDAPAMRLADEPVVLDIYDEPGHVALVDDLRSRYRLRGVFAEGADVEVTVAAAARYAGLPGIPVEAARNTKDKVRMRRCFEGAGIPNPRWAEVQSRAEAKDESARIGFPLMVKSVDNSASRGTTRVNEPASLGPAVDLAIANSSTNKALLESCFIGDEQSVETLFDASGNCHHLNIVDRPFSSEGSYAIELGHVNPTRLGGAEQQILFELAEQAASATGVHFGAFKADTIWTAEGPRILEVTARLSGGFDCQYTTPLSSGRNFIRAAMRLAVGMPLDPADLTHRMHKFAAAWVAFPDPGLVRSINGVEEALHQRGVREVFLRVAVGDVIQPYRDCAARPAFVIAVGDTADEAIRNAQGGVAVLEIETEEQAVNAV
jgi:biotin carboxylase